jgi:predicted RNA methylase
MPAGAFFTPLPYAHTFAIEVPGRRIIDLCAGIGTLSYAVLSRHAWYNDPTVDLTCVEINPDYIVVGKKILPQARWIQASILDLPDDIGFGFDCAISNPPFGSRRCEGNSRYTGRHFEFRDVDVASRLANYGVFIVPQTLSPFQISGRRTFEEETSKSYEQFTQQTGIVFTPNCGIDASVFKDEWHGASVMTEVVLADFAALRAKAESQSMPEDFSPSHLPEQGWLFPTAA